VSSDAPRHLVDVVVRREAENSLEKSSTRGLHARVAVLGGRLRMARMMTLFDARVDLFAEPTRGAGAGENIWCARSSIVGVDVEGEVPGEGAKTITTPRARNTSVACGRRGRSRSARAPCTRWWPRTMSCPLIFPELSSLGHAEVDDLETVGVADRSDEEEVPRLDVAVDDAPRGAQQRARGRRGASWASARDRSAIFPSRLRKSPTDSPRSGSVTHVRSVFASPRRRGP